MRLFAVLALLVLSALPAAAAPYADPRALLEALYAGYLNDNEMPPDERPLQSARLNALFDRDAAESQQEVGRIDFAPYVNGQDYIITDLVIGEPSYAGGKAMVPVTFKNFDRPQDMGFLLVKEEGGWKIDDAWNADPDYPYDLLDILQAPLPR